MTDAYYELLDADDPLGEKFSVSEHAISTWSATMQNGAPVSALLVRAAERCSERDDTRLSRVTVDLLGPVPMTDELWVRAVVQRPGTKIELVQAEMLARGPDGQPRPVAMATAWRFQHHDTDELFFSPTAPLRPLAEGRPRLPDDSTEHTFIQSLDWRWLNDILNDVPGECWLRPLVDLVKGEAMTPIQRLFSVADVANGMGSRMVMADWLFLNTDLVVHIHRVPEGEWIGIRADTHYGRDGVGVSRGTLFDEQGPVAEIQQAQLVRRR